MPAFHFLNLRLRCPSTRVVVFLLSEFLVGADLTRAMVDCVMRGLCRFIYLVVILGTTWC